MAIEDMILAEEWETSLYHLAKKQEENNIVSRFPEAALTLVDRLVDEHTHNVGDTLRRVLDAIINCRTHVGRRSTLPTVAVKGRIAPKITFVSLPLRRGLSAKNAENGAQ
ncbi:MAG: hypothetical protein R3D30_09820 [Hyphomicrobiales bacterium]